MTQKSYAVGLRKYNTEKSPKVSLNRRTATKNYLLKGLGHAILGNFSTDQMVIELTKK